MPPGSPRCFPIWWAVAREQHLRSLGRNVPHFTPAEARVAAQATACLLSAAARTTTGTGPTGQLSERAPVLLAIRSHIDAEIGSPDLSVEQICRRFGHNKDGSIGNDGRVLGLIAVFVVFAAWAACQLFAGRAAVLIVGAMIATMMSANVFWSGTTGGFVGALCSSVVMRENSS